MRNDVDILKRKLEMLQLAVIADNCKYDVECIYNKGLDLGLDIDTDGFWIWNIPQNIEFYSPKFRSVLGFKDESDFPNVPQSWMDQILPLSKSVAFKNFELHVNSKGKHAYDQIVKYQTKQDNIIELVCHGGVILWDDVGNPILMAGLHNLIR